jgi:hypothetical protein
MSLLALGLLSPLASLRFGVKLKSNTTSTHQINSNIGFYAYIDFI